MTWEDWTNEQDHRKCQCGSGLYKYLLHDLMGIPTGYVCEECEEEHKSKFAPHVFGDDREAYKDEVYHSGERLDDDY